MGAVLELLADVLGQLLLRWVPERDVWRWVVFALYAVLFALGVVAAVLTLT